MSGPVTPDDAPPSEPAAGQARPPCVEVTESHEAVVGRTRVRRALPRRGRRTVGAWCFADHMGPVEVVEEAGLDIGPHPHTGLQTVTWLVEGQVLHRDSLGSEQVIAPGQLNLMTAGRGVAHSEESTGAYRGTLQGIQLWVAQPDATRAGEPAFEHHAELPRVEVPGAVATVLVGELDTGSGGATSPARRDTPLLGADLVLHGGTTAWPLRRDFEYALVVLEGEVGLDDRPVTPGRLAYLGRGRDQLVLDALDPARVVLLGGEPFPEPLVMWWNFVGRSRDEIGEAYDEWAAGGDRFGRVASPLARVGVDAPAWHHPRAPRG